MESRYHDGSKPRCYWSTNRHGGGVIRIAGFSSGVDLAFDAICTGASLLPDVDEPGSTVSHVLESVSGAISYALTRVCDGHRKESHSLIGVALVTGLAGGLRELGLWHHIRCPHHSSDFFMRVT